MEDQTEKAFNEIKKLKTTAPVLNSFDTSLPISVSTDASDFSVWAVLEHEGRPVAFFPRTLNSAEQNYGAHDKELLAIVGAL